MTIWRSIKTVRHNVRVILTALAICVGLFTSYAVSPEVFDIDAAKVLCDSLPLHDPEGIWIYPEDGVTVMILRRSQSLFSELPDYDIRVVETTDTRLRNGEIIGRLKSTPERNKFEVDLFTERHNNLLLKPKTVIAKLSDEGETMILTQNKPKFSFRFTFNPSILLPRLWRIVRLNSSSGHNSEVRPAIGMIKIYPSYDGNGSSRRRPRYL